MSVLNQRLSFRFFADGIAQSLAELPLIAAPASASTSTYQPELSMLYEDPNEEDPPWPPPSNATLAPGPPPSPVIPTVSNLTPASGTPILPDTPIQFDITDVSGFGIIIPIFTLDVYGTPEPTAKGILDADFTFEPLYVDGSTRVAITNGYRYTFRRKGGWTSTPRLTIWADGAAGGVWIGP